MLRRALFALVAMVGLASISDIANAASWYRVEFGKCFGSNSAKAEVALMTKFGATVTTKDDGNTPPNWIAIQASDRPEPTMRFASLKACEQWTGSSGDATAARAAQEPTDWRSALKITKSQLEKTGFGSVAKWTVTIKNVSHSMSFKDIHFATEYQAPSGTVIDKSIIGHTEYRAFPAGKSVTFTFTELVHSQASHASIAIDAAVDD